MPRHRATIEALTVGQLAKRWGLGPKHVRELVNSDLLPDSFEIPSAGRYGATVKIPLATIRDAEAKWRLSNKTISAQACAPPRRRDNRRVALKHFPTLNGDARHDA